MTILRSSAAIPAPEFGLDNSRNLFVVALKTYFFKRVVRHETGMASGGAGRGGVTGYVTLRQVYYVLS